MESDRPEIGPEAELDEWLRYREQDHDKPQRRSWLSWIALLLGVGTLAGIVLLWPTGDTSNQEAALSTLGVPSQFHGAEIVRVEEAPCAGVATVVCATVDFELTAGPHIGFVLSNEFPDGPTTPDFNVGQQVVMSYRPANAVVRTVSDGPCLFDPDQTCRVLLLAVGEGADVIVADYELFPGEDNGAFREGTPVLADYIEGETGDLEIFSVAAESPQQQYRFADFERRSMLGWLLLLFAAIVIWLGRWRGVTALGGLAVSIAILLLFILPAILDGRSPVLVAVVGSAAIAFVALYLAHGLNTMTTVAVIGTMAALTATALLSAGVVALSQFTGFTGEESSLLTLFGDIDAGGLLLAGIVLGAAGAIDDVTVTQASAVWQLKAANATMGAGELYRRGLRIGRDHIASLVNTLLLAYAGASLPLMVLFVLSEQSLGAVANSEVVAVEIVRTLVGSIGLVAAVPFTTWLAAVAADGTEAPH